MKIGDRVYTRSNEFVTLLHVLRDASRRVATYAPDGSVCYELYPSPAASLESWPFQQVSIVLPLEEEERQ